MPKLISLNVGLPQDVPWNDRTVHTAIWKYATFGRRSVRSLNVEGDLQGDLKSHGGPFRAILAYQVESYEYWSQLFARNDFMFGQFGENFTVNRLSDADVRIGDVYDIGTAQFKVTEPRVTCYRVGIRMGRPDMAALLVAHHRPGFYMSVLQEGDVGAGDEISLVRRDEANPTVAELDAMLYLPARNWEKLRGILDRGILTPVWQAALENTVSKHDGRGWAGGTAGITVNTGMKAAWDGFKQVNIVRRRYLTADVVEVTLGSKEFNGVHCCKAGQFITVKVPGKNSVRTYSVTDTTTPGELSIAVKVVADGVASRYVARDGIVGESILCAAPRGDFVLPGEERPSVFITGGIGLTPVVAMLRSLSGSRAQQRMVWIHSCRDIESMPFRSEMCDLVDHVPNLELHIFATREDGRTLPKSAAVHGGRITKEFLDEHIVRDAEYYVCGPLGFMEDIQTELLTLGIRKEHIRIERFGSQISYTPGLTGQEGHHRLPHALEDDVGSGPRVSFTRSGVSAHYDGKRFHSLLDLAEACDVPVRWGCRTGVCHKCITSVIEGVAVDYEPDPLDPPGQGNVLICCCKPVGDITLDL